MGNELNPVPPTDAGEWDGTQWYEVKRGDTLSKIAREVYGDTSLYQNIEANRDT